MSKRMFLIVFLVLTSVIAFAEPAFAHNRCYARGGGHPRPAPRYNCAPRYYYAPRYCAPRPVWGYGYGVRVYVGNGGYYGGGYYGGRCR